MQRLGPSLLSALAVLAISASAAAQTPVDPDDDVLRYPPSRVRPFLITGGAGVIGISYGIGAIAARTWQQTPGSTAMLVPVVGPWIALGQNGCADSDPDCGAILYLRGILYALSGIAQAGGVGLIGEGIFMTTEADAPATTTAATVQLAPLITPSTLGVGVAGTF